MKKICGTCLHFEGEEVMRTERRPNVINPHATEEVKLADGVCKRFPQWIPHNKEDDCGEWGAGNDNERN